MYTSQDNHYQQNISIYQTQPRANQTIQIPASQHSYFDTINQKASLFQVQQNTNLIIKAGLYLSRVYLNLLF